MGFKTGKTVGELNLVNAIQDLIKNNVMVIDHPTNPGVCVQNSLLTEPNGDTSINLMVHNNTRNGVITPILIPAANIERGQIAGHSVFLNDSFGNRTQISFLDHLQSVDLEKIAIQDDGADSILLMDEALGDLDDDDDLKLWICEVGIYDLEDDPHTPYRTVHIAVAAEGEAQAREQAEETAQDQIMVRGQAHFSVLGSPEKTDPDDYRK